MTKRIFSGLKMGLMALALVSTTPFLASAKDAECACTEACQKPCQKGDHSQCDCKVCDCKNGTCRHHKCDH